MKILLFSDWHGDQSTAGLRRIDDLEGAFERVLAIAIEREVDYAFFLGDLADPDCGSILVRVLDSALSLAARLCAVGIGSIWISGNHDVLEDGSELSTLHPIRHARVGDFASIVVERPTSLVFGKKNLVEATLLPFTSRSAPYDPAEYMRANPFKQNGGRIVLGHCTSIRGARAGSETTDLARGGSLEFPIEECKRQKVTFMACGHFHHGQVTPDGVHIPGSLERLRFDEERNSPGILIAEV